MRKFENEACSIPCNRCDQRMSKRSAHRSIELQSFGDGTLDRSHDCWMPLLWLTVEIVIEIDYSYNLRFADDTHRHMRRPMPPATVQPNVDGSTNIGCALWRRAINLDGCLLCTNANIIAAPVDMYSALSSFAFAIWECFSHAHRSIWKRMLSDGQTEDVFN